MSVTPVSALAKARLSDTDTVARRVGVGTVSARGKWSSSITLRLPVRLARVSLYTVAEGEHTVASVRQQVANLPPQTIFQSRIL